MIFFFFSRIVGSLEARPGTGSPSMRQGSPTGSFHLAQEPEECAPEDGQSDARLMQQLADALAQRIKDIYDT